MDDVVPNTLQRLRAADIIRVAGLAVASLGQEYSRIGAVHATMRRGTQLLGIVDTTNVTHEEAATATDAVEAAKQEATGQHRCVVDVELQSSNAWITNCTCSPNSHQLCRHAAALLYQWLAQPQSFTSTDPLPSRTPSGKHERDVPSHTGAKILLKPTRQMSSQVGHVVTVRGPTPVASLTEILAQIGLSELRSIAREHELVTTGVSKQQLMESITGILKRPETVRKAAAALEKPQRQLLATMALAGGALTDEDLRGIYERFAFGQADKLQAILLSLQAKGLLFHTSLNSAPQQRIGLSGSVYDVGWYIPAEVQAALRVPVPITSFTRQGEDEASTPIIQEVKPYSLLTDLLLLARVLNGYRLEHEDERDERVSTQRATPSFSPARLTNSFINDGTGGIVPPAALPSTTLLATAQAAIPRSPLFLRYAVRLLRLADILHKDDAGTPNLRLLSNATRLLIGPTHAEVARDLFELWLTQPSYEELYDLQEEGLRLRCRTTPLNHSILRPGELEAENCEARQWLVALIAQVPQDQWVSFPAFARFIYRLNPTFLQKRQRLFPSPHWWLEQEDGQPPTPLQPKQMNDWMRAEGHYLARLIRGPLHWWGITDLALALDGHLLAFRLTPMAGLLLNGLEWEDEQDVETQFAASTPSSALEVAETGELLLSCSFAAWPLIALVEDFTEVAGVRNERLCYRLSPTFLAEALSRGQQPTLLLQTLHAMAAEAPPDSPLWRLITRLTNWTSSYGRVRLYSGVSLLEVADTMVLRELAATTTMEEHIVQTITPTLMILKRQGMAHMIEDLKRRGQTPLLHEEGQHGTE
ncbi:MAG: hypothetical protein ABI396_04535 [Ktedonobacteraceae bacterium]